MMAIERRHLGFTLPEYAFAVTAERVGKFAEAIGDSRALTDTAFVPPTFLKVIEGEGASSRRIVEALEIDLRRILHAEQQFDYLAPIHVGDVLTVERRVADIYEKKGGEMEFVIIETTFTGQHGTPVARSRQIILVRHPKREH